MSKVRVDALLGASDSGLTYLPWKTASGINWFVISSGSQNNYVLQYDVPVQEYYPGMEIRFKVHQANTGVSFINVNNLGFVPLKRGDKEDLDPDTMPVDSVALAIFDGEDFLLTQLYGPGVSYGYAGGTGGSKPPMAEFSFSINGQNVAFTNASSDQDGVITASEWSFGDGQTTSSTHPSHMYSAVGDYSVTLTVTDDNGQTSSKTRTVNVTNWSPTAAFTESVNGRTITFMNTSYDQAGGSISSSSWNFGDGDTSTDEDPVHTFPTPGNYTVSLQVTDNEGATASVSKQVTAEPDNIGPTAAFTVSNIGSLQISVNASGSSDPDGSIVSYAWNFGDGGTGSGQSATHTYASAGTYNVTLTVTDDDGATGALTKAANPVGAPAANFTSSQNNLQVTFTDTSTAGAGASITSRVWNFGDGTTSGAANPVHTYASDGVYTVSLQVTNSGGLTNTINQTVSVSSSIPSPATFSAIPLGCDTTCPRVEIFGSYSGGPPDAHVTIAQLNNAGDPSAAWTTVVQATDREFTVIHVSARNTYHYYLIWEIRDPTTNAVIFDNKNSKNGMTNVAACQGGANECDI